MIDKNFMNHLRNNDHMRAMGATEENITRALEISNRYLITGVPEFTITDHMKSLETCEEPLYFVWYNKQNKPIRITSMSTEYLLSCIKMFWENTIPRKFWFDTYQLMQFHVNYTDAYIESAIKNMYSELMFRSDLDMDSREVANIMYEYLINNFDKLSNIPRYSKTPIVRL